jgi:hypothetical protein
MALWRLVLARGSGAASRLLRLGAWLNEVFTWLRADTLAEANARSMAGGGDKQPEGKAVPPESRKRPCSHLPGG